MDHLCYFYLVLLCFGACLFIDALWSPAVKGLTSWLSFVMFNCDLSLSHWYPGSGVVLDCIDSSSLPSFLLLCGYFQKLEDLKPKPGNEHYLAALRKENVEKNRNLSILAG